MVGESPKKAFLSRGTSLGAEGGEDVLAFRTSPRIPG